MSFIIDFLYILFKCESMKIEFNPFQTPMWYQVHP